MKQLEDTKTIDMLGEPTKRGRGRPRKADALTNAQRQQRWRIRQVLTRPEGVASLVYGGEGAFKKMRRPRFYEWHAKARDFFSQEEYMLILDARIACESLAATVTKNPTVPTAQKGGD
jgi:hypothetical protein